jgi:hypothetical protein
VQWKIELVLSHGPARLYCGGEAQSQKQVPSSASLKAGSRFCLSPSHTGTIQISVTVNMRPMDSPRFFRDAMRRLDINSFAGNFEPDWRFSALIFIVDW